MFVLIIILQYLQITQFSIEANFMQHALWSYLFLFSSLEHS